MMTSPYVERRPTLWERFVCAVSGHRAVGPINDNQPVLARVRRKYPRLEPYTYACRRCTRRLRFNRDRPNGWVVIR